MRSASASLAIHPGRAPAWARLLGLLMALLALLPTGPLLAQGAPANVPSLGALTARLVYDDGRPKPLGNGQTKAIRNELGAYLSAHPGAPRALVLRGMASFALGNLRSARADFEQAVRAAPQLAAAHYNLGRTLESLRDWRTARVAYERAVELDPELAAAQFNLGRLYEATGELKRAESAYYAAWLTEPLSEGALVALGNIRFQQGDYRDALLYYEQARARTRGSSIIDQNRGLALEALGRYDEALDAFAGASKRAPRRAAARMGWARCAYRLGLWEQVERALDPLVSLANKREEEARRLLEAARMAKAGGQPPAPPPEAGQEKPLQAADSPGAPQEEAAPK